jgi:2C-methyl-D-erythritol 2,4-cyclodiphosphate synthase
LVSVWPELAIASAPMTSTGTGLSATVRSVRRVPVTTIGWTGNRLDLDIGAMGQQVAAEIDIQESLVRLKVTLPPALAFFGSMLEPLIRRQGNAMLEDKSKKG